MKVNVVHTCSECKVMKKSRRLIFTYDDGCKLVMQHLLEESCCLAMIRYLCYTDSHVVD